MREPISLSDSTMDMVVKMAEGSPGAISVIMQLMNRDDPAALMDVLSLDDMNIRGSQIWLGYKDHCGEDIEKFAKAIKDRDEAMIATINANTSGKERAVKGGASFDNVAGSGHSRGMRL